MVALDQLGLVLLVIVVGFLTASVAAGSGAWRKHRRVAGVIGFLAPIVVVASHFNVLLWAEGTWAPTFYADIVGLFLGVVFLLIASVATLLPRRASRRRSSARV